jgi:hypothetical protein
VRMWSELMWVKRGTSGGFLFILKLAFGLYNIWGTSRLFQKILVSEKGIFSVELNWSV